MDDPSWIRAQRQRHVGAALNKSKGIGAIDSGEVTFFGN
jgi:hypothetical protein